MFGKKKNKEGFKLNINKEQAEKEYEEYLNQPPEVKDVQDFYGNLYSSWYFG